MQVVDCIGVFPIAIDHALSHTETIVMNANTETVR